MADFITENYVTDRVPRLMKGKDQLKVRDSKLTGFMLRCRRNADDSITREFLVDYLPPNRAQGETKRKTLSIGRWPTFTAEDAREAARVMLQGLKDGIDPAHARAAKNAEPTVDELWEDFLTGHVSMLSVASQKDYASRWRSIIKPAFTGRKVASVTRAEVDALRRKHKRTPTGLNRALAVLSKMMTYAILKEMRTDNPVKGVQRFPETPNETWVDENDIGAFIKALGGIEGPVGYLIRFVAVTGWRITAARCLRWDQVDLRKLDVKIKGAANKLTATALSADAATLIDSQKHRMGFVFSNCKGREPIGYKEVLCQLTIACKKAGLKRITPHTMRRTIATHSAIAGANVAELMQSYGWKTPAMAMRYVKKSESLARKGVERGASVINIFGKESAEVVDFPARG